MSGYPSVLVKKRDRIVVPAKIRPRTRMRPEPRDTHRTSSELDWGNKGYDWIPACAGMT